MGANILEVYDSHSKKHETYLEFHMAIAFP